MTINTQSARNAAFFIATLATALALGGALAHIFEFANKMSLGHDAYLAVQTIYAGWNRIAYILLFELVGLIAVIVLYRHRPRVVWPVGIALACFLAAQAIFWIWTFPANVATENWTTEPESGGNGNIPISPEDCSRLAR